MTTGSCRSPEQRSLADRSITHSNRRHRRLNYDVPAEIGNICEAAAKRFAQSAYGADFMIFAYRPRREAR